MKPSDFDRAAKDYQELKPAFEKLQGLENNVWRAINALRYDQPRNRLEEFLMQIFAPSHQWAAMTTALMIGIVAAYAGIATVNSGAITTAQALRLDVFQAHYGSPLGVLVAQQGGNS